MTFAQTFPLLATALLLSACSNDCSAELLGRERSVLTNWEARAVRTNCGATSGYAYEVRVARAGSPLDSGKTILIADNNHQPWPPGSYKKLIRFTWTEANALQVELTEPVRLFRMNKAYSDIAIHYRLAPGTELSSWF